MQLRLDDAVISFLIFPSRLELKSGLPTEKVGLWGQKLLSRIFASHLPSPVSGSSEWQPDNPTAGVCMVLDVYKRVHHLLHPLSSAWDGRKGSLPLQLRKWSNREVTSFGLSHVIGRLDPAVHLNFQPLLFPPLFLCVVLVAPGVGQFTVWASQDIYNPGH